MFVLELVGNMNKIVEELVKNYNLKIEWVWTAIYEYDFSKKEADLFYPIFYDYRKNSWERAIAEAFTEVNVSALSGTQWR